MKFSLNNTKKPSKPGFNFSAGGDNNNDKERDQPTLTPVYVTEFDPSQTLTDSTKTLTVAPLQNQWRPSKRMKNLELPIRPNSPSNLLQFESQSKTLEDETKSGDISYGLTIRKKQPGNNAFVVNPEVDDKEEPLKGQSLDERLRFREELDSLGDDLGYEDMPVEEFGKALLRGYGWSEGKGVGKNPKVVDVWMNEKRAIGNEGLGFGPNKIPKPEEPKPRSVQPREEKKGEGVSREEERRNVRGNEGRSREDEKRISNGTAKKKDDHAKPGWLISHIRVRVISKDLKGGRLYLKKGEVVDVVGLTSCDLLMDESRELIQGVDQELLETALPKRGGPVFVLSGKHKGVHGNLVERDLDREIGVVRDADTHELFKVKLEQIAEYIGDPSLVGY